MNHSLKNKTRQNGFTLIEVMVVIVLVGLMVSVVQFSSSSDKAEETLEFSSKRFAGIFDIAAEYGMLNNVELGLMVDKNSYQFLGALHRPICQIILQKFDLMLKVDYANALLQALLYLLVVSVVQLFVISFVLNTHVAFATSKLGLPQGAAFRRE